MSKEIDKMTKQEVLDEMSQWQLELDGINERMFDLDQALTHNFPHMIGGNDCEDAFSGNPTNYDESIIDELPF